MQKVILNFIFNLLSRLPIKVAYFISDILYFAQNHFFKYRKKIVINNLKKSFPTEPEEKIKDYYYSFNRHLCDYAMESLILPRISKAYVDNHIKFENLELLKDIYNRKQDVIMLAGHIFNWEYTVELARHIPSKNKYAVYKPVRNKAVNDFIKNSRSKYNVSAISMQQSVKKMLNTDQDGETCFLLVADQSPFRPYIRYSLNFFNQETPVFHGFDQLIRKKNFAVVYINIEKPQRGKYTFKLQELKPEGETWKAKESIHKFFEALENNIKNDPPNWLWSHKRWKYKKGIHY